MKTHNLVQGSAAWLAYRAQHFNASDAAAMLGCSPHKTRAQLLAELHFGRTADPSSFKARVLDSGHRFEALARPLGERIVGEDLYPVVGSLGELSASFDGLNLLRTVNWEHKRLNEELRACFAEMEGVPDDGARGRLLPKNHRVQAEQQLLVSGAERVLFMASDWDERDQLIEEQHCWYYPDPELRAEIIAGWKQFAIDLANYKHVEVQERPAAAPVEALPVPSVRINGALAIVDNLPEFGEALRAFVKKIPAQPTTDQEFADTDAACKALKKAEEALAASETSALASLADVNTLRTTIATLSTLARDTRLAKEKLVTARKEQIKREQIQRGKDTLAEHIAHLNERIGHALMPLIPSDFAAAISGVKTMASLHARIDQHLADKKIEANAIADRIQVNLRTLDELAKDHRALFADVAQLVLKPEADCRQVVEARVANAKAAEERRLAAERERIRQEEAAKLEREAQARAAQERAAAEAEQRRKDEAFLAGAEERERQRQAEMAAAVLKGRAANTAIEAEHAKLIVEQPQPAGPGATVQSIRPTPAPAVQPTLRLGQLCDRLGFTVSAEFMRSLGIEATRDRNAVLFVDDMPAICNALIEHIASVRDTKAAA